jgi:cobyrinic acid a,c-diamide synthase
MTVEDNPLSTGFVDRLAEMAEQCLDIDGLAKLGFDSAQPADYRQQGNDDRLMDPKSGPESGAEPPVRIAVARDAAFCFIYPDNLRLLREAGAEIVEFSPLADAELPVDIHGIYLPGGYPELYAERLAANTGMLSAIRTAFENDMPVYAECGGLIYLSEGLAGGTDFAGIFPVRARMLDKRKALGYRQVEISAASVIGTPGMVARGHEFHYSEIGPMPERIARTFRISRRGDDLGLEGYCYRNCLASYVHLHFGSNPDCAALFVDSCREFGNRWKESA